jgi:WD40 repeat protein/serine/threonine protein kinase
MPSARDAAAALDPEPSVRRALAALEADLRELALRALAAWERLEIPAPDLFPALAALQRPSWGSWNGLLQALRAARRAALRAAAPDARERIERAAPLGEALAALEQPVDPALAIALGPLADLVRAPLSGRPRLGAALALPIALRNRIAHDAPQDADFWRDAARALAPLIERREAGALLPPEAAPSELSSPWFLVEGEEVWALNGMAPDFAVTYVSRRGAARHDAARGGEVLLAFQRLLGKAEGRERDLKRLLARLAPEESKGVLLGDFLVGAPVGEGGFATVHAARQLSTGRKVAVKILRDGLPEEAKLRFRQEAAFLSRITHRSVVGVIGYGEDAWRAPRLVSLAGEPWFATFSRSAPVKSYIALEWIEGRTLEDVFRTGGAPPRALATWFAEAAGALAAVHAVDLVHRDVKPSNVMITEDGAVKLMDFGIARTQSDARTLVTLTGQTVGTPAYMSPEQLRAAEPGADAEAEVGPATDVYSLAAIFYELFTGRRLFDHDRESSAAVRARKLRGERPARPAALARGLDWELGTIVGGGLEPEVADRYASAAALERDLRRFLADEPIHYRRPSLARQARLLYRRNRLVANLVAAFAVLVVAGLALYVRAIGIEKARTSAANSDAREKLLRLYEEQGRQEVTAGRPLRGLVYLAEAYREGARGAALRYLLAEAARPADALVLAIDASPSGVSNARFSPDAARIATGAYDGAVAVWDAASGRSLARFSLSTDVPSVVWSPDGARIVTKDENGAACVWDAATGQRVSCFDGPLTTFWVPEFSPDGARVLSGPWVWDAASGRALAGIEGARSSFSPDGARVLSIAEDELRARVWDAASGKPLLTLETAGAKTRAAAWSPDGARIATGSEDGAARIWDGSRGTLLLELPLSDGLNGVGDVVWSPDGARILALRRDEPPVVLDVARGTRLATLNPRMTVIQDGVFSPDGQRVFGAGADGTTRLWEAASGLTVGTFEGHVGGVRRVDVSRDGGRVLTAGNDGTARVWDATKTRLVALIAGAGQGAWAARFSPDGARVAMMRMDGSVAVTSAAGEPLAALDARGEGGGTIAWSPDGARLAAVTYSQCVRIWEPASGRAPIELPLVHVLALAWSPDGRRLAAGTEAGKLILWDAGGRLEAEVAAHEGEVRAAAWSRDGTRLATASEDRTAKLWDASLRPIVTLAGHQGRVLDVAFSADGSRVLTASGDCTARVWDAASGAVLLRLEGHPEELRSAAFSPDGTRIATASEDHTAGLWDARTGALIASLEGHSAQVRKAAWSPDGARILTFSADGRALVWDGATGALLAALEGHTAQLYAAEWSPDGARALTAGQDGRTIIWDVHLETRTPREIADLVRRRVPWRLDGGRLVRATPGAEPADR